MKKEGENLVLTAVAMMCLAILFIYSWRHSGAPAYLPSGVRIISPTVPLGAALLLSIVSLVHQIRAKR
ncbi:MAG: hypothetical protein WCA21_05270 [Terracidiphilus sp.]